MVADQEQNKLYCIRLVVCGDLSYQKTDHRDASNDPLQLSLLPQLHGQARRMATTFTGTQASCKRRGQSKNLRSIQIYENFQQFS